jgi:hypothetical protein
LLEGLKAEVDGLNTELEEGALTGWPNGFAVGCVVFVDCPNNDICGLGSSGFCRPGPKRLPGWAAGWLWPKLKRLFEGCAVADAPKAEGAADWDDCPNEKGAAEGVPVLPLPKVVPNVSGFFCGDSIIVSPSDWGFVGPFVWAPNPPKLTLLAPLFPVLVPRPLNGFEVVCGANVKVPDGGVGLKEGKEALVLKFDAAVVLLLPKGVEIWTLPLPKGFDVAPLANDGEPVDETAPWSLPLGALSLWYTLAFCGWVFILERRSSEGIIRMESLQLSELMSRVEG